MHVGQEDGTNWYLGSASHATSRAVSACASLQPRAKAPVAGLALAACPDGPVVRHHARHAACKQLLRVRNDGQPTLVGTDGQHGRVATAGKRWRSPDTAAPRAAAAAETTARLNLGTLHPGEQDLVVRCRARNGDCQRIASVCWP